MTAQQRDRQPSASYQIRVRGHLGKTMLLAFPGLRAETRGPTRCCEAPLPTRPRCTACWTRSKPGLELLEVRRVPREPR